MVITQFPRLPKIVNGNFNGLAKYRIEPVIMFSYRSGLKKYVIAKTNDGSGYYNKKKYPDKFIALEYGKSCAER